MKDLKQVFKALGDSRRMKLLETLCSCRCEQSVGELERCCEVDLSVVSRHLAQLRDAGLVTSERRGRSVFYSADSSAVASVLRDLADAFEACGKGCCDASLPETKQEKTNE